MKTKLAIAATTLIAAFAAGAETYTWTGSAGTADWATSGNWSSSDGGTTFPGSSDTAFFSGNATVAIAEGQSVGALTLENNAVVALGSDGKAVSFGAIGGAGTIAMNRLLLSNISGSDLTIASETTIKPTTNSGNYIRHIGSGSKVIVNGKIEGDSGVILNITGENSNGGVYLAGDNSGYRGQLTVQNNSGKTRLRFSSHASGLKNGYLRNESDTAGAIAADWSVAGTIAFGRWEDSGRKTDNNYYSRFSNVEGNVLEIGWLDNNGLLGRSIAERKSGSATRKVTLRKVGTGMLEVYDSKHDYGTKIDNGTLLVTHPMSLSGYDNTFTADNYITFGSVSGDPDCPGGTLKYGNDPLNGNEAVTTDWSALVKNSYAPIAVDTNGKDITWASALPASNVGGLVKKGAGTLDVQGYSTYAGKTIVSNGTLKVGFEYSTTDGVSREWEVSDDAKLEVELRSRLANAHAGEAALLSGIPAGSTVNLSNADYRGIPRFTEVTTFTGIVNFCNSLDNSGGNGAGGFVGSVSPVGSNAIDWGITGEPASANTRVFNIEGKDGMAVNLGAFRLTSTNAMVYAKHSCDLNIGALAKGSVINGKFEMQDSKNLTVNSTAGTLALGEGFGVVANGSAAYTGTATFNITGGTFVNNADLSAYTVNIASGVTLGGTSTFGDVDLLVNDVVAPDAATITDKTADYPILTATSFSNIGSSANLNTLLATLNAGETKGSWKVRKVNNGDGTVTLKCVFVQHGFTIVFK